MMVLALSAGFAGIVWLAIVSLNETRGLLSCDRFPTQGHKYAAYAVLLVVLLVLAVLVAGAAGAPATAEQLATTPFYSLFLLHGILIVFLVVWWALSGTPDLREFLNIRYERPAEVAAIGIAVGVGGWIFTIIAAMVVVLLLQGTGVVSEPPAPPPMIGWMAGLPIWKKALIILSAMTVEEFFFRSFLQKRVGLVASTILFALAHFTYGNPLLLIGITIISLVIGVTFHRTKNVVPCIVAHGVFDAIQLFVIIPIAYRMMGGA